MDRHDAGMFEVREHARFAAQPPLEIVAAQGVGNLDGDFAAELFVDGEEHSTHAATPDFLGHRIAAGLELRPSSERAEARDGRIRQTAAHGPSRDLHAEELAGLSAKLFVAAAETAQDREGALPESPPHLCQRVGDLRCRQPELFREERHN